MVETCKGVQSIKIVCFIFDYINCEFCSFENCLMCLTQKSSVI